MRKHRWPRTGRGCNLVPVTRPEHRENRQEPGAFARSRYTKRACLRNVGRRFPLSISLTFAAFPLWIVALVELTEPAHPVHATLEIAAGAALFLAGEAGS